LIYLPIPICPYFIFFLKIISDGFSSPSLLQSISGPFFFSRTYLRRTTVVLAAALFPTPPAPLPYLASIHTRPRSGIQKIALPVKPFNWCSIAFFL